jgi:hypothetical protein
MSPNQTNCAVGMTGSITAKGQATQSDRRQRNGTRPKFFNDFSRAPKRQIVE